MPAGPVRRLIAFAIDMVAFAVLASPLLLYCFAESFRNAVLEGSAAYWGIYGMFVATTGIEAFTTRSIGKWVVGARVLDSTTFRPAPLRAAVRWLLKLLPVHCFVIIMGLAGHGNDLDDSVVDCLALAMYAYPPLQLLVITLTSSKRGPHDFCTRTGVYQQARAASGFPVVMPAN
jgi:uncharacterized RDD family membrane protein YckC